MCTSLVFCLCSRKASRILKTPRILVFIKLLGFSIDLSTCVSAAKLKIIDGL